MKLALRLTCTVAMLALFFVYFSRHVNRAALAALHPHLGLFALSWLLLECGFLLCTHVLRYTFHWLGACVTRGEAYSMFFISNLGRYVPGRVWQIMAMTLFVKRRGVSVFASTPLFLVNQLAVLGAGVLFTIVFAKLMSHSAASLPWGWILPLSPLLLIFVFPNLLLRAGRVLLRLLGRGDAIVTISHRYVLYLLGFYLAVQVFNGLAFVLLIHSLGLPLPDVPFLLAVYPFCYIIGYVSLVTPGGIGIRESFMLFLLKHIYAPEQAAVIALASLVWFAGLELINGMIALMIFKTTHPGAFAAPAGAENPPVI